MGNQHSPSTLRNNRTVSIVNNEIDSRKQCGINLALDILFHFLGLKLRSDDFPSHKMGC